MYNVGPVRLTVTEAEMKIATLLLLGCLALTTQENEPELLKEAPEGWRFERIEFPLEFAPDLKLTGFEELRFGPGMFDPKSDSYFSYVLAMQFEKEEKLNAEFVRNLFQKYFVGLCRSVSESRQIELDLEQIKTEVEFTEGVFHVSVSMFDPFVTGEALALRLLVTAHPGEDDSKVNLLGLASPADSEAEIWKELKSIQASFK